MQPNVLAKRWDDIRRKAMESSSLHNAVHASSVQQHNVSHLTELVLSVDTDDYFVQSATRTHNTSSAVRTPLIEDTQAKEADEDHRTTPKVLSNPAVQVCFHISRSRLLNSR